MSLKALIAPPIANYILGDKKLHAQRRKFERARLKRSEVHIAEFFHDPSDPYSQLLQIVLPDLTAKFAINIKTHIISPPDESAVPERDALTHYARLDAERLAAKAGLDFKASPTPPATNTSAADARLKSLGHYLGGTLYYGGEWYWGLDRLHYLETRLQSLGLLTPNTQSAPLYTPPFVPSGTGETGAVIHWYLSFRSPYTAITASRIKALAGAYGASLKLRKVLPMVMRDLPVPKAKSRYIPRDTAREARRLGIPFGRICDPVGTPVERGYSLLPWAIEQGRGFEYVDSFLSLVWSQGVNAGSDKGLRRIVETAGLDWATAKPMIGTEDWREMAETNRQEMINFGIWGVPSFRIDETIVWGQDRLWVIEDKLKDMT